MKTNKIKFIIASFCLVMLAASCNAKGVSDSDSSSDSGVTATSHSSDSFVGGPELFNTSNLKVEKNALIPEGMALVVDFYADWCGPCRQYSPIFHQVAEEYQGKAMFLSINIDDYPEFSKTYNIQSIPFTAFILPGGGVMGTQVGLLDKATLTSFVNQLLATNAGDGMGI